MGSLKRLAGRTQAQLPSGHTIVGICVVFWVLMESVLGREQGREPEIPKLAGVIIILKNQNKTT